MNFELVESSIFGNEEGCLGLAEGDDGQLYLRMEDAVGATYYGPLEEQHVEAFKLLNGLPEAMWTK